MRSSFLRVIHACLTFAALCACHSALAATITFDDLDASAGDLDLAALGSYQGFTWSNFQAYTDLPGFDGFNNGIVSGPNAAYTGGETAGDAIAALRGTISSVSLFDFTSAALGAGWYDGLSLTVQGSRNGGLLFSQTVNIGTGAAQQFQFNFTAIDTLTFFAATNAGTTDPFLCGSFNCTQVTLDNFVFEPASDTPPVGVPEPSTAALLLAGLIGGLPLLRRGQNAQK